MTGHEELLQRIDGAYRRLAAAREVLAEADRALDEHVLGVRQEHAEELLEAKNERAAKLYMEGLLATEEYRRLSAARLRADLRHEHARREVERLHLVVRLLAATANQPG